MELTDIQTPEEWVKLEKEIFEKSGLDASVFNTDGIRITDYKEWVNRLCPVIKANDKGQSFICAVAHMNLAAIAKNTKDHVIEECDAGLAKILVPIFVDDEFIGSVGACGFILDDGEVDSFMINKTIGLEEEKIEALSNDIKTISTENAQALCDFIKRKLNDIVRNYQKS
jgi:ligand-binding sensor protein